MISINFYNNLEHRSDFCFSEKSFGQFCIHNQTKNIQLNYLFVILIFTQWGIKSNKSKSIIWHQSKNVIVLTTANQQTLANWIMSVRKCGLYLFVSSLKGVVSLRLCLSTDYISELSHYIENIEKYRKLLDRRSIEFRKVPNMNMGMMGNNNIY